MEPKQELIETARSLGRMSAKTGDMYDMLEALIAGYAEGRNEPSPLRTEIACLNAVQHATDTILQWRVEDAREAGQSWEWIADALEVSRQAAWRKYRKTTDQAD